LLGGFAAVTAFAFAGLFLATAEQWLGDQGFGPVWALFAVFGHAGSSLAARDVRLRE
jgi:hypothetical protein